MENDVQLMPYDRIVIPFRQYYVTVSGAVFNPGKYPYIPNRSFKYYLELAGGSDPEKNNNNSAIITDVHDEKQDIDRIIQPEDNIYLEYSNPLFHINQWAFIVGTTISLTALIISIIQLTK